jgi:hypothetical protein
MSSRKKKATAAAVAVIDTDAECVFRKGSRISGVSVAAARQELLRIREDRGDITPEIVVEEAASPDSPIHAAFEWDNAAAAHEHRLSQARHLVKSVRLVVDDAKNTIPAFVHVVVNDQRSYQPIELVVQNRTLLESATEQLVGKLDAARQAVEDVQRAAKVYRPELSGDADEVAGHLDAAGTAGRKLKGKAKQTAA